MGMQRLRREGETGNVLGKLRVSKDEAAEGAEQQILERKLGHVLQVLGRRLTHPSPAGCLGSLAPAGPSCQATGHLRPRGPLSSRWARNFCHHRQAGATPGMPFFSSPRSVPQSLVTVNITDAGPATELPWVLAGQG